MTLAGLERLVVWKKAEEFAVFIYREVIPALPVEEKYGLNQQLRRSAQSIPANIAEGYGRFYYQETVRFCYNARGSLEEVISHLVLAHDLGYLKDECFRKAIQLSDELVRLINGFIKYMKQTKSGEKNPVLWH